MVDRDARPASKASFPEGEAGVFSNSQKAVAELVDRRQPLAENDVQHGQMIIQDG